MIFKKWIWVRNWPYEHWVRSFTGNPWKVTTKKISTVKPFKNILHIIRMNTKDCSKKTAYFNKKTKRSGRVLVVIMWWDNSAIRKASISKREVILYAKKYPTLVCRVWELDSFQRDPEWGWLLGFFGGETISFSWFLKKCDCCFLDQ